MAASKSVALWARVRSSPAALWSRDVAEAALLDDMSRTGFAGNVRISSIRNCEQCSGVRRRRK